MKNNFALIGTILLTATLFSCSSNDPSSSAKEILKNQVANNSRGYFKLINMEKTDAVTQTVMGVKTYSLRYTAEIECIKDGGWIYVSKNDGKLFGGLYATKVYNNYEEGNTNTQTKVGEKYKFDDRMTIQKHEQGWVWAGR